MVKSDHWSFFHSYLFARRGDLLELPSCLNIERPTSNSLIERQTANYKR
jgi:hypothetical protein